MMGRWLLKTEPQEWSWEHQEANGGISNWDGVRNAQAQKHLRAMEVGDLCFFYHSGTKAKEIIGIARVCKPFYPDRSDDSCKHGMVDIEAVSKLLQPLPLSRLKQEDRLHNFLLFRQPRLSVVPVSLLEWNLICELAGELEPPLPVDDHQFRSNVDKETVGFADGEGKASNISKECRVSDKTTDCDYESEEQARSDIPSLSSPEVRKQPRKRKPNVTATNVKVKTSSTPTEAYCNVGSASNNVDIIGLAEGASTVDEKEDYEAIFQTCSSIIVNGIKFVPETKKVYSRRSKKLKKVGSLHTNAEIKDSRDIAPTEGASFYKRRNR